MSVNCQIHPNIGCGARSSTQTHDQVRLHARRVLHRLDSVKERDILAELKVGRAKMTCEEAILEQLSVEHMKDMQSRGTKFDGMKENMVELN